MFGKALEVSGLEITASINGGIDVVMEQAAEVVVTCLVDGDRVKRVHADEGIEFLSQGGFVSVQYKAGADITDICDLKKMALRLRAVEEENEAMRVHTKGE